MTAGQARDGDGGGSDERPLPPTTLARPVRNVVRDRSRRGASVDTDAPHPAAQPATAQAGIASQVADRREIVEPATLKRVLERRVWLCFMRALVEL